jgi:hypothetical protein
MLALHSLLQIIYLLQELYIAVIQIENALQICLLAIMRWLRNSAFQQTS